MFREGTRIFVKSLYEKKYIQFCCIKNQNLFKFIQKNFFLLWPLKRDFFFVYVKNFKMPYFSTFANVCVCPTRLDSYYYYILLSTSSTKFVLPPRPHIIEIFVCLKLSSISVKLKLNFANAQINFCYFSCVLFYLCTLDTMLFSSYLTSC